MPPLGSQLQSTIDTNALIIQCQQTEDTELADIAINKLLRLIQTHHMPGRVRKFKGRNVLVQQTDVECEFMLGCWKAVKSAKLDIGNPLQFICWKGELAVLHLFRKNIREGVRVNCTTCGIGSIAFSGGSSVNDKMAPAKRKKANICCGKCGATDVTTFMVVFDQSQVDEDNFESTPSATWDKIDPSEVKESIDTMFNAITYDIEVQEIRRTLNGRVLQLFDTLVVRGINRDTSTNYLEEIAQEWQVSTACVSVYLRKLRGKVLNHIAATKLTEAA